MKRTLIQRGKGPLELIEEAVHLLRMAPVSVLSGYYLGSLPFVLGLLYFWADMSRSALAARRLPMAALGLTLLFVWMKTWQAVFARQLLATVRGEVPVYPGWGQFARMAVRQVVLHSTGLLLLPVALVFLLPFGWVYAFYQSITALEDGAPGSVRLLAARAWRQALLWPGQNHYGLLALKLFGLFVCVNLLVAGVVAPQLLKSLLGVDTVFSRYTAAFVNTTFFATLLGLTYLALDPLLKCFYVLRCFYGASLATGEDLRAELKQAATGLLALASLMMTLAPGHLAAAPATPAEPAPTTPTAAVRAFPSPAPITINGAELDRALQAVLQQREFQWRLPRERTLASEKTDNAFIAWIKDIRQVIGDWMDQVRAWIRRLVDWLFPGSRSGSGTSWVAGLHWLLVALIGVLAVLIGLMLVRWWRGRKSPAEVPVQATPVLPDLADENVGAEQLPEDQWVTLARTLLARGETRLALRAFHLASLAHLAERQLINLARYKSNRDYERELDRRSHALPELTLAFSENVTAFDRSWYGLHEVTADIFERFAHNVEQIKART